MKAVKHRIFGRAGDCAERDTKVGQLGLNPSGGTQLPWPQMEGESVQRPAGTHRIEAADGYRGDTTAGDLPQLGRDDFVGRDDRV